MRPARRRRAAAHAALLATAAAAAVANPAAAATAPLDATGGAFASPVPRLTGVACRSDCAGVRAVRRGSVVELRGRELSSVARVVFLGGEGARDDVVSRAVRVRPGSLQVRVPRGVASGPVLVETADGARSAPARGVIVAAAAPLPTAELRTAAGGAAIDVELSGEKVYFGGERDATLSYMLRTNEPATVSVELVRVRDGASIARWDRGVVAPDTPQTLTWDGLAGGRVQRAGRYQFRVHAQLSTGVQASSAQADPSDADAPGAFLFLRHKFPVRGPHGYGEFAASFGGGRGHQGQDVFAECGTPLVAARAGVVKFVQYHSRAGHYLVIDGEQTDVDYVYMHLRDAPLVDRGDRVYTGQLIGYVGDTGRASGCHLHFELWSGPGWYSGGEPFDPKPDLLAWDASS